MTEMNAIREKLSEMYGNILMYGIDSARNTVSRLCDLSGVTDRMIRDCYRDPQMIRVVNYHRTPDNELKTFEAQLAWYRKNFENIDYEKEQTACDAAVRHPVYEHDCVLRRKRRRFRHHRSRRQ